MSKYEVILIMIGIVAYTIKAMQPTHFLDFIPAKIKFGCFPCISAWLSAILIFIWDFMIWNYEPQLIIHPIMFLFIGASGYSLFKFLDS